MPTGNDDDEGIEIIPLRPPTSAPDLIEITAASAPQPIAPRIRCTILLPQPVLLPAHCVPTLLWWFIDLLLLLLLSNPVGPTTRTTTSSLFCYFCPSFRLSFVSMYSSFPYFSILLLSMLTIPSAPLPGSVRAETNTNIYQQQARPCAGQRKGKERKENLCVVAARLYANRKNSLIDSKLILYAFFRLFRFVFFFPSLFVSTFRTRCSRAILERGPASSSSSCFIIWQQRRWWWGRDSDNARAGTCESPVKTSRWIKSHRHHWTKERTKQTSLAFIDPHERHDSIRTHARALH